MHCFTAYSVLEAFQSLNPSIKLLALMAPLLFGLCLVYLMVWYRLAREKHQWAKGPHKLAALVIKANHEFPADEGLYYQVFHQPAMGKATVLVHRPHEKRRPALKPLEQFIKNSPDLIIVYAEEDPHNPP